MHPESQLLEQVLARVALLVRPGTTIPRLASEDHDLSAVATALLHRGWLQAQAVLALSRLSNPEVAIPNLRSLFEAFGELHHLASAPDPRLLAQTAFLFAVEQMKNYNERWIGPGPDLDHLRSQLATYTAEMPAAMQAVAGRRNFWTAPGRATLIEEAIASLPHNGNGPPPAELGRQLYKILSWDDHHVMAVMLSVDLIPGTPTFGQVRAKHVMDEASQFLPLLAAVGLEGMRLAYVRALPEAAC